MRAFLSCSCRSLGVRAAFLLALVFSPGCSASGPTVDAGLDVGSPVVDAAVSDLAPVADASSWRSGVVSVVEEPGSAWRVVLEGTDVVARHREADLALLIDATNGAADGRYAGIYVIANGVPRFDGSYNGTYCSTFVPDRPFMNQESVTVVAAGKSLRVTMTEGSLSSMVDSKFTSQEPFRWESTWSLETGGLRLVSRGLFYILPSKHACQLTVLGEGGVELGALQIASDTPPLLRYFEEVRTIKIVSTAGESFTVATDARVLQVEVPGAAGTELFELDFDHSFKDRGQLEVRAETLLAL